MCQIMQGSAAAIVWSQATGQISFARIQLVRVNWNDSKERGIDFQI